MVLCMSNFDLIRCHLQYEHSLVSGWNRRDMASDRFKNVERGVDKQKRVLYFIPKRLSTSTEAFTNRTHLNLFGLFSLQYRHDLEIKLAKKKNKTKAHKCPYYIFYRFR